MTIIYNFQLWLKRIGRKGVLDYYSTYTWMEEDEIVFTALVAMAED